MTLRMLRALTLGLLLALLITTLARGAGPPLLPFDCTGDLYVMDTGSEGILRITPSGDVTLALTEAEILAATGWSNVYWNYKGCAFDASGNLYFAAEELNGPNAILKWRPGENPSVLTSEGEILAATGESETWLAGMAFGSGGFLYLNEHKSNSVLQVDPNTGEVSVYVTETTLAAAAGSTSAYMECPIVGAEDGVVYTASDSSPDSIFKIDETGTPSLYAQGSPFVDLSGFLTRAPNGDLIIADYRDNIFRVAPGGTVTTFLSEAELEAATCVNQDVTLYGGIAFDDAGNFYLAETNTDTIYRFDPALQCSVFVPASDISAVTGSGVQLAAGIAFAPCTVTVGGVTSPNMPIAFLAGLGGLALVGLAGSTVLAWRRRAAH